MYFAHAVTLVLFGLGGIQAANIGTAVERRDASTSVESSTGSASTPTSTSSATSTAATSTVPSSLSSASNAGPSSTISSNEFSTSSGRTTAVLSASSSLQSTTSNTVSSAALVASATAQPDALPIQPTITPAVGIIGVLFIVTGVALALIGIKHQWLHIFLSTAFLTSLSVTVLIIYVMNPPVSNAVQGAYMVAGILTGLIFGSISLIFKDVTEGLGCLLGGFCVAMWFLVLVPGGLIRSTSGRSILIGVFCAAGFSLSFSQYTRNYGLILCTAFAGATVTILGIDCFSRAGLKEFWLYIWNLNNNEFPINTKTYPITRGIRVEIASVIIIFLFGICSQIKIWKIVKERKAKRQEQRMKDDERRDKLDSAVGRDIEASNERDRFQWEALYGEKTPARVHVDSGIGSSIDGSAKRSMSVKEREVEVIEMADIPRRSSKRVSKQSPKLPMIIQARFDEDARPLPTQSSEYLLDTTGYASRATSQHTLKRNSNRTSAQSKIHSSLEEKVEEPHSNSRVVITPLPFLPPIDDHGQQRALGEEPLASDALARRPSAQRHESPDDVDSDDRLSIAHIEDDRASSMAATAAEDVDIDALSTHRLSVATFALNLEFGKGFSQSTSETPVEALMSPDNHRISTTPLEEMDEEELVRPPTARENTTSKPQRGSISSNVQQPVGEAEGDGRNEDGDASVVGSLKNHLPQRLSKVAVVYRTNEWAKHIADADTPEIVEDPEPDSPGVKVDRAFVEETAKPVDPEALQQTTSAAEQGEVSRKGSQLSTKNPYRQSNKIRPAISQTLSNTTATPIYAFRSSSQLATHRDSRPTSAMGKPKVSTQNLRISSTTLAGQPLVESPVEYAAASPTSPKRNITSPLEMASTQILTEKRNDLLKRTPTTASFNALVSAGQENTNIVLPSDSASMRAIPIDESDVVDSAEPPNQPLLGRDEDDVTLSQRKAAIQQAQHSPQRAKMQSPTFQHHPSRLMSSPTPHSHSQLIYDSHQPQRTPTVDRAKQSAMLTAWRSSLQQLSSPTSPDATLTAQADSAQAALLQERRQAEWMQLREKEEKDRRESAMDAAMRSGWMNGAHRDAMRRMQARARESIEGNG